MPPTHFEPLDLATPRYVEPALILLLDDATATLAEVGGKGAALARLAAAGLPVPGGFHVSTTAYTQFVAANQLQPRMIAALAPLDAFEVGAVEQAARAVAKAWEAATIPDRIAQAITAAYKALGDDQPPVAVRSSATAEDLPELSFAGQHATTLNVRGAEAVLTAVKRCWASLWTARAIDYRLQHGVDHLAVRQAVVVQRLVPAAAAGVLFTADPMSGRRDRVVISATWGLGEAIVGGKVTPDLLTVDKASRQILSRDVADKQVMTVLTEHDTSDQPIPPAQRRMPVLDDAQAAELTRLGLEIEALYGVPMDVEWARSDDTIMLLQARPITALPDHAAPGSPTWDLPALKGMYLRASIVEHLPDPLSPLFATMGVSAIDTATRGLFRSVAGDMVMPSAVFETINGYAYYHYALGAPDWLRIVNGAVRHMPEWLGRAEQRWRDVARPGYLLTIERWQHRPIPMLAARDILEGVRQTLDGAITIYTTLQSGIIPMATITEFLFTAFYERFVRREHDPPALTFLLGFDSTPILAEKALFDLAAWCRERPVIADYLRATPAAQLDIAIKENSAPDAVGVDDWQAWHNRFQGHLDRYGHMVYSLDFAVPLPADEPEPLLATCKLYLDGHGSDPYARQRMIAARRRAATAAMLARLRGPRLALFHSLLMWAQRFGSLREDGLADLGLGYPLARRLLREFGIRLERARAIEQVDDVFWLHTDEVDALADALDRTGVLGSYAEAVRQRKVAWQAARRVTPPVMLPPRTRWLGFSTERWMPARSEQLGETLTGVAASPGRVTATARVLHDPSEFDQMQPGDILVAAITTPAWTPLLARAAAVVTDVGGPLSHSSIVAREYGIPAVLGTGLATRRIHSGQRITVDGTTGSIQLLDTPPRPRRNAA